MRRFKEIDAGALSENFFELISKKWMLITAGKPGKLNTMTASWGGIGVLWNKQVTFSFVRPQRYTYQFMESNDYYTLSFFGDEYRAELAFCGANSGRDVNKLEQVSFTPVFEEAPYFEEAKLVFVCRKIYGQLIDPACFLDEKIAGNYPNDDYHKMYVGEIVKVLVKE